MRIFLIDTENVGWNGLSGVGRLTETDTVYIFGVQNFENAKISADIAIKCIGSKAEFHFEHLNPTDTPHD